MSKTDVSKTTENAIQKNKDSIINTFEKFNSKIKNLGTTNTFEKFNSKMKSF